MLENILYYVFTIAIAAIAFAFFYFIFKVKYNAEKSDFQQSNAGSYPSFLKWLTFQGEYGTKKSAIKKHAEGKRSHLSYVAGIIIFILMLDVFLGSKILSEILNIVEKNVDASNG